MICNIFIFLCLNLYENHFKLHNLVIHLVVQMFFLLDKNVLVYHHDLDDLFNENFNITLGLFSHSKI